MQTPCCDPIYQFPALLARLPPGVDLEGLARETRAFLRPRGVRSGTDLFRLALALGAGEQGIAMLKPDP